MDGLRVQGSRVSGFKGLRVLGFLFPGSCRHRDAELTGSMMDMFV